MAKHATHPVARRNVFKATLTRFAGKMLPHKFAPEPATVTPDPISLAIFAIDRVARPPCAPAPRASKSASQHRTKLLLRYFALR
jgi:hypothetical protein